MMLKRKQVGDIEISINAQKEFQDKFPESNIVSCIKDSVTVKFEDSYGDEKHSNGLLNEKLEVILPLRNRDGENGWGIPTVLGSDDYYILGDVSMCPSCHETWHEKRDYCLSCGNELRGISAFHWRGIEITNHCQIRALERLDIQEDKIQEDIKNIIKEGVFTSFSDGYKENTICILNESKGAAFPIRNRDNVDGVGMTTVITSDDIMSLIEDENIECEDCDKTYHLSRDTCPFCQS